MSDFEQLWPGGPVFRQAAHFRLGTDTVLLADFIRPDGRRRGIDLGCASGALMLLLLSRAPRLRMTGLELSADAAERARGTVDAPGNQSQRFFEYFTTFVSIHRSDLATYNKRAERERKTRKPSVPQRASVYSARRQNASA